MSLRLLIALSLVTLALAGCGAEPPTAGAPTDFADVCAKANDGKRVAVEGFLSFPDQFSGDSSVVLRMFETDSFDGKPIGVQISFGGAANQIEQVSARYSDDDLKIHLADGGLSRYGEKVRVSGKVYFPLVGQDFDCALENPLVETVS